MYLAESAVGAAAEDRRFALRRATDDAHARVEGIVQGAGMFASREAFRRYLTATYEMRARYERLLDLSGAAKVWPDWPGRRIAELVAQDIVDLGGGAPAPEENSMATLSKAELIGVLYVLEGSSLGARVLVKSVEALGLTEAFGARHLYKQAGDRSAWRSFMSMMSAASEAPCHDAARATFDAFAAAYSRAAA